MRLGHAHPKCQSYHNSSEIKASLRHEKRPFAKGGSVEKYNQINFLFNKVAASVHTKRYYFGDVLPFSIFESSSFFSPSLTSCVGSYTSVHEEHFKSSVRMRGPGKLKGRKRPAYSVFLNVTFPDRLRIQWVCFRECCGVS